MNGAHIIAEVTKKRAASSVEGMISRAWCVYTFDACTPVVVCINDLLCDMLLSVEWSGCSLFLIHKI